MSETTVISPQTMCSIDCPHGTVEVPVFQLLQWKHALRLESKGLTFRGGSVTAHVREVFTGKRRGKPSRDQLIEIVTDVLDQVNAQMGVQE